MGSVIDAYRTELLAHDGSRKFYWEQGAIKPHCAIYFIHAAQVDAIKIGRSVDPFQRLRDLYLMSPVSLKLIGYVAATIATEKALHAQFAPERMHGEWFRVSSHLRFRVDEILSGSHSRRLVEAWP